MYNGQPAAKLQTQMPDGCPRGGNQKRSLARPSPGLSQGEKEVLPSIPPWGGKLMTSQKPDSNPPGVGTDRWKPKLDALGVAFKPGRLNGWSAVQRLDVGGWACRLISLL
jgi:hypothetical protein